jgi:hypothetical protein
LWCHVRVFIQVGKIFTAKNWPFSFCDLSLFSQLTARYLCGELALDEGESLGSVLVDILLVRVGVVAVAAVWVCGVAV